MAMSHKLVRAKPMQTGGAVASAADFDFERIRAIIKDELMQIVERESEKVYGYNSPFQKMLGGFFQGYVSGAKIEQSVYNGMIEFTTQTDEKKHKRYIVS